MSMATRAFSWRRVHGGGQRRSARKLVSPARARIRYSAQRSMSAIAPQRCSAKNAIAVRGIVTARPNAAALSNHEPLTICTFHPRIERTGQNARWRRVIEAGLDGVQRLTQVADEVFGGFDSHRDAQQRGVHS